MGSALLLPLLPPPLLLLLLSPPFLSPAAPAATPIISLALSPLAPPSCQEPVHNLDDMISAVSGIADGAAVKLKLVDLQGQAMSATLKCDYVFWPTQELQRDPTGQLDWQLVNRA